MAAPFHRCWAEIDLAALRQNLVWIRQRVGPGVNIMTVVKADAYGHGLKQIAGWLMHCGTDLFGVANLAEAQAIRSVGSGWPALMLGASLPEEREGMVRDRIMATVSTQDEARHFSEIAGRVGKTALLHVKIDTGMGRLGADPAQTGQLLRIIRELPHLHLMGLYTHYACAEDDEGFSEQQRRCFVGALKSLPAELAKDAMIHANNSAGILFEPETTFDAVRPGLLVYGIVPPGKRSRGFEVPGQLRPALSLKCRVSLVKDVPCGAALSYGRSFVAPQAMRVATITAGYGDGYLRNGSNRAEVLIGGQRCRVVGRITMDQTLVDVTPLGTISSGDEVVMIGRQDNDEITAAELATWCDSIPWEVLTSISYRVPRVYRGSHAA